MSNPNSPNSPNDNHDDSRDHDPSNESNNDGRNESDAPSAPSALWDDSRITSYALGELPEDERQQFESDIANNPELSIAVDQARGITDQLSSLYGAEETPPLDEQRRQKIADSVSDSTSSQSVRRSDADDADLRYRAPTWGVPLTMMALAAVVLLLVGIAPWLRQRATITAVDPTLTAEETRNQSPMPQAESTESADLAESAVAMDAAVAPIMEESAVLEAEVESQDIQVDAPTETAVPELAMKSDAASADSFGRAAPYAEADAVAKPGETFTEPAAAAPAPTAMRGARGGANAASGSPPVPEPPTKKNRSMSRGLEKKSVAKDTRYADENGESKSVDDIVGHLRTRNQSEPTAPAQMHPGAAPAANQAPRSGALKSETAESISPPAPLAPAIELDRKAAVKMSQPKAKLAEVRRTAPDPTANAPDSAPVKTKVEGLKGLEKVLSESLLKESSESLRADSGIEPRQGRVLGGQGEGPEESGDKFERIDDNPFKRVSEHPVSTFSADVDTASYSKVRDVITRANSLPRPDAVRIEELVNYFSYDYKAPADDAKHPFSAHMEITGCPWTPAHRLARIAIKGKEMKPSERPPCNLVFLLDSSGSMKRANKLPLVVEGMKMLTDQLNEDDRVSIAVYAGSAGLVLDSTPANKKNRILEALTQLSAGGSTNGGAGIALAYHVARENFLTEGVNRVILCTDGDFNVGLTGTDALVRMVEKEAQDGIFLSVLGFGMGNHNDAMLEKISGRGNGNYAFIDTKAEARKVLVDQTSGTLVTIAKDVKLQLEFNPKQVSQYRLIGYENRILAKEDFVDDKKDAGEIGAGHTVTALYEIVPAGVEPEASRPKAADLKYQKRGELSDAADSGDLLTLKLRYKQPDETTSTKIEFPVKDDDGEFETAESDLRFAAAVAGFGMKLRGSPHVGKWTLHEILDVAESATGEDELRGEFVEIVQQAIQLTGEESP